MGLELVNTNYVLGNLELTPKVCLALIKLSKKKKLINRKKTIIKNEIITIIIMIIIIIIVSALNL